MSELDVAAIRARHATYVERTAGRPRSRSCPAHDTADDVPALLAALAARDARVAELEADRDRYRTAARSCTVWHGAICGWGGEVVRTIPGAASDTLDGTDGAAYAPEDVFQVEYHDPAVADQASRAWRMAASREFEADVAVARMRQRRERTPQIGPMRVVCARTTYTVVAAEPRASAEKPSACPPDAPAPEKRPRA
ncbi:MAG TPA: hypothetical protein VGF17_22125 [Phytomonospora sp.]